MRLLEDKPLYFLVGFNLAAAATVVTGAPWIGVVLCLAAGITKEIWEYNTEGIIADGWDAFNAVAPGVIVYLFATYGEW